MPFTSAGVSNMVMLLSPSPSTSKDLMRISRRFSRVWLVQRIMFAGHVKTWANAGCTALANVKSYSQVTKPFSTKQTRRA